MTYMSVLCWIEDHCPNPPDPHIPGRLSAYCLETRAICWSPLWSLWAALLTARPPAQHLPYRSHCHAWQWSCPLPFSAQFLLECPASIQQYIRQTGHHQVVDTRTVAVADSWLTAEDTYPFANKFSHRLISRMPGSSMSDNLCCLS